MAKQLKSAVIGAGIMGAAHAEWLRDNPTTTVSGVADVRAEAAKQVASTVGARPFADYRKMLAAQKPDLVVIATPDPLHREPLLAALDAGVKRIIMEKPLATTAAEAGEMADAVRRAKAQLYVNFSNRYNPMAQTAYYCVDKKLVGSVIYGEMKLDDHFSVPIALWGRRSRDWVAKTTVAHFLHSHMVDLMRWLLQADVVSVYAISQSKVLKHTPDLYDAFLTFDNGAKVRLKAEWIKQITRLVESYFALSGTKGGVFCNYTGAYGQQQGLRVNVHDPKLSDAVMLRHRRYLTLHGIEPSYIAETDHLTGRPIARRSFEVVPTEDVRGAAEAFARFIDGFLEETDTPKSIHGFGTLPTLHDGLRAAQVVCAIIESAEKGEVVSVGP